MARKTASDLTEQIADLAEKLQQAATDEIRTELAQSIEDNMLGRPGVSRTTYRGESPEDCIINALATFPTMKDKRLKGLADRFGDEGVSPDFEAGVVFALRLFADLKYDY